MYIPTPAHQTHVFLLCIGFGFLLGLFYHTVRFVRKTFFSFKRAVLIQDIIYCVISTFAVFCFLLCCNDGEVRFFTLLGLGLGLLIYYFTLGIFAAKVLDCISRVIRKILKPIRRILNKVFVFIKTKTVKFIKKSKKTSKKQENKPNNT